MRVWTSLLLVLFSVSVGFSQGNAAPATPKPTAPKDRMSYSIGADIGRNLKNNGIDLNIQQFFAGIRDALTGQPLALTDKELGAGITAFQTEMQLGARRRAEALAADNAKQGKDFLVANAKKPGVKTTASGLQYKVIKAGTGPSPKATDRVTTHYEGRLINGTVFDSSIRRGEPATFPVNGVIKGWQEALQLMKVGDKLQLFIPAGLAYGERGAGRDIGPNATLIFDIELIRIEQ